MVSEVSNIHDQRLPTELILTILTLYVDRHMWGLPDILLLSRSIYRGLRRRRPQQVHLYSVPQCRLFTASRRLKVLGKRENQTPWSMNHIVNAKRSLFIHFLERGLVKPLVINLMRHTGAIPEADRSLVDTLALRTIESENYGMALGLWTCALFKNVQQLYVDMSMKAPYNTEETPVADTKEELVCPLQICKNVRCYALSVNEEHYTSELLSYVIELLPSLERLYIFTHRPGSNTSGWSLGGITDFANTLEARRGIKLIVNVIVKDPDTSYHTPTEGVIQQLPNGIIFLDGITIDRMRGTQDAVGLMHRVIDDIDREWSPDTFQGQWWSPSTRPRYITAIPTRSTMPASSS